MNLPKPLDSMRDAVLTVSPNRQYRGIFKPTTPATTGPKTVYFMELKYSGKYTYRILILKTAMKFTGMHADSKQQLPSW